MKWPSTWLRRLGWLEGLSFLLLLSVAMPLKYVYDQPMAVKIFGWFHGGMFVLLGIVTLVVMKQRHWSIGKGALVMVAGLIPFGPWIFDRRIESYESES